jgi:hypothetical protein
MGSMTHSGGRLMKTKTTLLVTMLLVGMLAMGAQAQSDGSQSGSGAGDMNQNLTGEPKNQSEPHTSTGLENAQGAADQTQHFDAAGSESHGAGTQGSAYMGSMGTQTGVVEGVDAMDISVKSMDNDTGSQDRTHNTPEDAGLGGCVRNVDYAEDGGPHGPVSDSGQGFAGDNGDAATKIFIDEDGDGFNDVLKSFGADGLGDQIQDGSLLTERHNHAMGGSNQGSSTFGEAQTDMPGGEGTSTRDRGSRRK